MKKRVLNTTLFDKGCRWLATGLEFFPDTLASSINKTDHHDITEILLKVARVTSIDEEEAYVLVH
jgi:hypothetical protein